MATQLNADDLLAVRWWSVAGDQASVQTLHYTVVSNDGGALTDQNVANFFDALAGTWLRPLLNNLATYRGTEVRRVSPLPTVPVFQNVATGIGTGGPIGQARQVRGLMRFASANPGRAGRGRIYLPFPSSAALVNDGEMNTGYETALQALAFQLTGDQFPTDTGPAGFGTLIQVIPHSVPKGGTPPPPPPSPVIGWTVSNRWATQRKSGSFGRQNSSPI